MVKYLTVSIRNLPLGTTAEDVRNHINGRVPGAQPQVGPLVPESHRPMVYTTVTLQQESSSLIQSARDKLHGSPFFPRNPQSQHEKSSTIVVSEDFLGVTTVAEDENPQFDLYFIHGLGGHAFRSWSTDNLQDYPVMWPRDLLPEDVRADRLAGRYSTVGYKAQALSTWAASTTISKAADNLLSQISTDRPESCDRPIYFVCHSLGGLVTCQALINALYTSQDNHERYAWCNNMFTKDGRCLVKGIFFFGTPFDGSKLANFASKIVKFLNGNGTLIDSLKYHSEGLNTIVSQFNQLRSSPDAQIPILIAYEKQPMYGIKFVTQPDSAMGSYFGNVTPFGIDGDHRTMIKFPHRHDAGYQMVSRNLIRMIRATLPGVSSGIHTVSTPEIPTQAQFQPPPRRVHTDMSIRSRPPPYSGLWPEPTSAAQGYAWEQPPSFQPPIFESEASGSAAQQPSTAASTSPRFNRPTPHPAEAPRVIQRQSLMSVPEEGMEDMSRLALLSQFDVVFIIDDSGSMNDQDGGNRSRWSTLIDSMRYIVDIVCAYDEDGVDVHFLFNDGKDEQHIHDGQRILDLLSREIELDVHGGGTFMGDVLWMILQTHVDNFEVFRQEMRQQARGGGPGGSRRGAHRPQRPKKLNLIVITDGEANDKEDVEQVIVSAARKLDQLDAPHNQIGIQFLQIGQNKKAAEWLGLLDNKLKRMYDIRDMVDTRPFNSPKTIGVPFKKSLEQILLGPILREVDEEENYAADS